MNKKRITLATVLCGSIFAVLLSFSQPLNPAVFLGSNDRSAAQTVSTSLNETQTFISASSLAIPSFSLPAPFHIQSHLPCSFLFEIFTKADHADETYTEEPSLHPNRLFVITFRLIISANAP
ncbi:MAG TPA: hypothetical protein VFO54_03065 [Chryseosolibacter sp.]|nr:hypothetical protein [Chryseosolibacter sp.]